MFVCIGATLLSWKFQLNVLNVGGIIRICGECVLLNLYILGFIRLLTSFELWTAKVSLPQRYETEK